jgi:hypothetical protein
MGVLRPFREARDQRWLWCSGPAKSSSPARWWILSIAVRAWWSVVGALTHVRLLDPEGQPRSTLVRPTPSWQRG